MSQTIGYISPDELKDLMKSDQVPHKDFVVVDVRDDDRIGGHIKGSVNKPSGEFLQSVDSLVKDTKDVPVVVFHCALSQVRGPKAARVCAPNPLTEEPSLISTDKIYAETRKNVVSNDIDHKVMILRDGFSQFQDDPELVEDWDKDVWASDWS